MGQVYQYTRMNQQGLRKVDMQVDLMRPALP